MDQPRDRAGIALAFLLPLGMYLATPAAVMNGDGFGYFNRALSENWLEKLSPGHLLYTPLLAGVGRLAQAVGLSPLTLMRLVNQLAGAGAVGLLYCLAGRCGLDRAGRALVAAGFAFSFGIWVQATDLEAYALPLVCVIGGMYALLRHLKTPKASWSAIAGVCIGLAALFHLVTATLGASALLGIALARQRAGHALAALLIATGLTFLLPVAWFGIVLLGMSPAELPGWLLHADHGYPIPIGWLSLPRAVYGFMRTFVVLDSFWSASLLATGLKGLGILIAISWLGYHAWRRRPTLALTTAQLLVTLLPFILLQAALGVWFFGSDSERWLFLAPIAWLGVGLLVQPQSIHQRRLAGAGVGLLAVVNLLQGIGPLATDRSIEARVQALARAHPGPTLLITPGHDWLRYFHVYEPDRRDIEIVSLFLLAMEHPGDADGVLDQVQYRVRDASNRGTTVLLYRVLDPRENFHEDPWQMLASAGLPPDRVIAGFRKFDWQETTVEVERSPVALHRLMDAQGFTSTRRTVHAP